MVCVCVCVYLRWCVMVFSNAVPRIHLWSNWIRHLFSQGANPSSFLFFTLPYLLVLDVDRMITNKLLGPEAEGQEKKSSKAIEPSSYPADVFNYHFSLR